MFLRVLTALLVVSVIALPASAKHYRSPTHSKAHTAKTRAHKTPVRHVAIVKRDHVEQPDYDWTADIDEAQKLLEDDQETHYRSIDDFDWLLAIKCGEQPIMVTALPPGGKNADGYSVKAPMNNGINTRFTVVEPSGCIVLAQKRVVRKGEGLEEAVYTAYNPLLDTESMRAQGLAYLEDLRTDGFKALEERAVPSLAFPDETVAEVIPQKTALVLFIIEHIDPGREKRVGIEQCVNEVLVTLAANREHTYEYSVSTVRDRKTKRKKDGARGLAQVMQKTYDRLRELYPTAGLMPDFLEGMRSHENAVLAALLHFDVELKALPEGKVREFFRDPENYHLSTPFFAAAYNWNAVKVVKVYLKTKRLAHGLPRETRSYVGLGQRVTKHLNF